MARFVPGPVPVIPRVSPVSEKKTSGFGGEWTI
jgi:hypothetical protein